jgi:hypothetical protein
LQLTPNSSFQSIRGTVLAAGIVPTALAVSAVWAQLNRMSVRQPAAKFLFARIPCIR